MSVEHLRGECPTAPLLDSTQNTLAAVRLFWNVPFPPLPIGGNVTPRHKGEGFGWEYESGQWLLTLAGAQPGKSVGAPFLAANAMMDSEKALGIVFLLHGGQPEIV